VSDWEKQIIGRKFPAFFGKGGVELDPTKMPEELVGNWEIEGKQGDEKFVFSINPLSGYRPCTIMAIQVTTDKEFNVTDIDLSNSYGFPACVGSGRPWSVNLNVRECQQISRLLKGMVGIISQKAICTKSQGPWFY